MTTELTWEHIGLTPEEVVGVVLDSFSNVYIKDPYIVAAVGMDSGTLACYRIDDSPRRFCPVCRCLLEFDGTASVRCLNPKCSFEYPGDPKPFLDFDAKFEAIKEGLAPGHDYCVVTMGDGSLSAFDFKGFLKLGDPRLRDKCLQIVREDGSLTQIPHADHGIWTMELRGGMYSVEGTWTTN